MVWVMMAIERAGSSEAIPAIVTGVLFVCWAAFVHRTGWSASAIASRLLGGRAQPSRMGPIYWMTIAIFLVFGLAALISGVQLLAQG